LDVPVGGRARAYHAGTGRLVHPGGLSPRPQSALAPLVDEDVLHPAAPRLLMRALSLAGPARMSSISQSLGRIAGACGLSHGDSEGITERRTPQAERRGPIIDGLRLALYRLSLGRGRIPPPLALLAWTGRRRLTGPR